MNGSKSIPVPGPADFLMNLLQGPPLPPPAGEAGPKPSWENEVKVVAEQKLTPSQCPVAADLCLGMRNRISDLDAEEQQLLARLDLLRRERSALRPAYASLVGAIAFSDGNFLVEPMPAQEEGDLHSAGQIVPPDPNPA